DLRQSDGRAANISTRGTVSADAFMIAGCIVGGTQTRQLVIRALGPSLRNRGVSDALSDPRLQLFNAHGTAVAMNDNWQDGANAAAIQALGLAPESTNEAALLVSLAPGAHTAIEQPGAGESGVGLIEIYEVTPAARPD
ncbi:MAG TPA: hypothetical protein VK474_00335, partial [Chthoniobacterales bacterium]|nr:hypothetical protein [Chthoniobacterales bacterium]